MGRKLPPHDGARGNASPMGDGFFWRRFDNSAPRWADVPFENYAYEERRALAFAQADLAFLDGYLSRLGKSLSHLRGALEFGAGLTHGSEWLAHHLRQLTIAETCLPQLLLAQERLKRLATTNVRLVLITNYWNKPALPTVDLLYSIISLREDTPTSVVPGLDLCLSKVAFGGLALIRAPTHHKHYELMLPEERGIMELHTIPQWKIFDLLESNGFTLIAMQEEKDLGTQNILFHTFFARRQSHDSGG